MNFENYKIEIDGVIYASPCLAITLFSGAVVDKDNTEMALLIPYKIALNEFKDELTWCYFDFDQNKPIKTENKHLDLFEAWLSDPKARAKGNFFTTLWAGRTKDEWTAPGVSVSYHRNRNTQSPLVVTDILLPLSWLDARTVDDIKNYINKLVIGYPLLSGYVGLSFIYNSYNHRVMDVLDNYFNQWLMRHPGLMQPAPDAFSLVADKTLPDISWMTLLGEKYTEQLGGSETIQAKLNSLSEVVVEPLGQKGTLITIGDRPSMGDINQGDDLPLYKQVGQALSSLHDGDYIYNRTMLRGFNNNREQGKLWIDRFFVKE